MKMKRSELVKAAKELNETLGLDPRIDVKKKSKALTALIKEAAGLIDSELDDLTDSTSSVIAELTKEEEPVKKEEELEEKKEEFKESEHAMKMMEEFKESEHAMKMMEEFKESEHAMKMMEDVEKKKKAGKKRKFNEKTLFLLSMIKEGKFTRKEIIEKTLEKFPSASKSSLGTLLTDSKNPKYNRFDKLVKQGKDGILSF